METNKNDNAGKEKLKKYAVFALMFAAFLGCLWFIFAPSATEKEKREQGAGYNDRIPDASVESIIGDKRGAYEQEYINRRQSDAMVSLEEYSVLLADRENINREDGMQGTRPAAADNSPIAGSASSYRDIHRTLDTFYDYPQTDDHEQEILALEWKLQEMERKLEEKENRQAVIDEQMALMEKSYQLAAKYMPGQTTGGGTAGFSGETPGISDGNERGSDKPLQGASGKITITPIRSVQAGIVSALAQTYSDEEMAALFGRPRNYGFHTLKEGEVMGEKNTIKACIDGDQTVMSGQSVFIRLLEPILIEDIQIPPHTVLTAKAALEGERLALEITSIEYGEMIFTVKAGVYDTDGVRGIHVPASMELDALKEVAANMSGQLGSSYTVTQNAGAQIASDMTKGLIQGASQYFAKKVRMVKVHLKAGHNLFIYPEKQ